MTRLERERGDVGGRIGHQVALFSAPDAKWETGLVLLSLLIFAGLFVLGRPRAAYAAPPINASGLEPADVSEQDVSTPRSAPVSRAAPDSRHVDRIDVSLDIYRGGDPFPDTPGEIDGAIVARDSSRRRVPARAARVDGIAVYSLSAASSAEMPFALEGAAVKGGEATTSLLLLNNAEAIWREPVELDEVAFASYSEGHFELGRLDIWSVVALSEEVLAQRHAAALSSNLASDQVMSEPPPDAGAQLSFVRVGPSRDLRIEVPKSAAAIEIRYRVVVPHRYWPFGCVRQRCSLSGALAPLPSAPVVGGPRSSRDSRAVAPTQWKVRAAFATPREKERQEVLVLDQDIAVRGDAIHYPTVIWGPRWRRSERTHRGVRIEVLALTRRPKAEAPFEDGASLLRDIPGRIFEIARGVLDIAAKQGISPPPNATIVVIQGPLRSRIAETHPTAVLISDESYQLLTLERLLDFHDAPIARGIADLLALAHLGSHQRGAAEIWLSGAIGTFLTSRWEATHRARDESAADLLRGLSFMPAVDRFLYTGQASYSSAYFRASEDDLGLREHPFWSSNDLPSGRLIHEKLVDLLGAAKVELMYREIIRQPGRSLQETAETIYGRELDWFFEQWLGPSVAQDVAIVDVVSTRVADGFQHAITVQRVATAPLLEPLAVIAIEKGGRAHPLLWNGDPPETVAGRDGATAPVRRLEDMPLRVRKTLTLHTKQPLKSVRIDPRNRINQTPLLAGPRARRKDNVDPVFNDRWPKQGRFIYTGFGLSVAFSEAARATTPAARWAAFTGFAAFEVSLRRDLRRSGTFLVFKDRETVTGGFGAINFDFGRKRNLQRRVGRFRVGGGGSLLNNNGLDRSVDFDSAGVRISESATLSRDTRRFGWWPERGDRLELTAQLAHTVPFDRGYGVRHSFVIGTEWVHLWRIAHDHVIASQLYFGITTPLGSQVEFRSLLRGGGLTGLSAFQGNEIFGRGLAVAQLEYRHVYVNELPINVFNLAWVRSLGGTLLGGVTSASSCEGLGGWFDAPSWYGQVGYGLMAYVQNFGASPQLVRLDISVPLGRRESTCLGRSLPGYLAEVQGLAPESAARLLPAIAINLLFAPSF